MEESFLKEKLCRGVVPTEDDEFRKVEKVLAPFLRTLKKRKRIKTDVIADDYKELYLKNCPKELLSRLEDTYTDPVRMPTLLNETAQLLKSVTNSKCFNLYLTDYDRDEILLVSEYSPKNDRFEQRFRIETGTYLACHVAYTKEYVISSDILGDPRFPDGIPFAGPTVKAAICIPIVTSVQNNCIGVVELYRDCFGPPYNLINLQICSALTAWLGIAVEQASFKSNLAKELDIHSQISQLSKLYFSRALSFEKIISDLLTILKTAVGAEKGTFYVFEETVPLGCEDVLFADAYEEGISDSNSTGLFRKKTKVRYVKDKPGIPGYVARTGEIINIRDAFKDSRFDRTKDTPLFRTRSLLCFPIQSCLGVVAVLKLSNKLDYQYFSKEDIDFLLPHLNDVSIVCQYYELDTRYTKSQLKLIEKDRFLDIQTKPYAEEILVQKNLISGEQQFPPGFHRFEWDTLNIDDEFKCMAFAILNSDLLEPCFEFLNLEDFLLRVKKGYRPLPYHNFEHAFSVFHCIYVMLHKNKEVYDKLEIVSLIIAAVCHDIDHSGLTNNFIRLKNDVLAQLYEDFCDENHRYEVTMYFVQVTNVLSKFSSANYQVISKNLKRLIIGFDLAVYFQNRKEITELLNSDSFNWSNQEHRDLSQNMILMCADNCACFKSFDTSKKFTLNFSKELQMQGDLEKAMEFEPLSIMDSSKSDSIAHNQILLMKIICVPTVEIVIRLLSNLTILGDLVNQTLEKWKDIVSLKGQEMWKMNVALIKDKRDRRTHRVSVSRSSSIRTFTSEK